MKRKKYFCLVSDMNDHTISKLAERVCEELELRGLPDASFRQGYKASFLAALRDDRIGPGQVWNEEEAKRLRNELDRRFAA